MVNILTYILSLFVIIYYLFRPLEGLLFLIFLIPIRFLRVKIKLTEKSKKALVIGGILAYLTYSYYNTRIHSHDGLNTHLKYILQIAEKGFVNSTEYPIKPYFGEIILGHVYKNLGLRALNLTLGILTLLNTYLVYQLLKTLETKNEKVKKLAFLIFLLSPTFLGFAFKELKIDLISSAILLLALINFRKLSYKASHKRYLVICLLTGIVIITKTSAIPIAITILIAATIKHLLKNKNSKTIITTLIGISVAILPSILWALNFGGTIPQLENLVDITPQRNLFVNRVSLERDPHILAKCNQDKLKKDYSSFIFGSRTPLVLLQPIFYLTRYKAYPFSVQSMANPGILLYFGLIILFPYILFKKKSFFGNSKKEMYWLILTQTVIFYILVGSVFWYLLPLYPFYALLTASFLDHIKNARVKKLFLDITKASLITNLIYALILSYMYMEPLKTLDEKNIKQSDLVKIYEQNKVISKFRKNFLILDASEHGHAILTPFVPGGDEFIVKSNYYFASSPKNPKEMKEELIENGIKFIMAEKDKLEDSWYTDCPKENNKKLKNFLDKHTVPVFPRNTQYNNLFFEIVDK
ncbi:hypothetical protein GF360_00705 [candidate division WWE3 bacterium]|nr:hypothetical protein [candidate division WWE3 bacterium]